MEYYNEMSISGNIIRWTRNHFRRSTVIIINLMVLLRSMYHYLAFKVWSASQPLMKKRWKLNGLTNPGLLNGVESIFLFSLYSREYILSLQSILNIYQVLLNRAHRDIHIWHSVISTDPPIRPGTDPCPEYMAVTTNTLYVLKENN